MEFSARVIILRVGRFREADLWVRVLSPERGVFSAFAFGGSRSRKRFSGCLDLFNDVLFKLRVSRQGEYTDLLEGVLINAPRRLRHDWQRTGMAVNCARFIEAFGAAPDGALATHTLFSGVLRALEQEEAPSGFLPVFFRARLLAEQGYGLDHESCAVCGANLQSCGSALFALHEGFFLCPDCARRNPSGPCLGLQKPALEVLGRVLSSDPEDWGAAKLDPEGARQCARALDAFARRHSGLVFESGRFVRE